MKYLAVIDYDNNVIGFGKTMVSVREDANRVLRMQKLPKLAKKLSTICAYQVTTHDLKRLNDVEYDNLLNEYIANLDWIHVSENLKETLGYNITRSDLQYKDIFGTYVTKEEFEEP